MTSKFKPGTHFFLTNCEIYEIIEEREKSIYCAPTSQSSRTKSFWLPKAGMVLQKKSPLVLPESPETYKLKNWVKFN
jgi:hypothetical protein